MAELISAIRKAHDSATGSDFIHYQMLKNLPEMALDTLLRFFNDLWVTGICHHPGQKPPLSKSLNRGKI